MPKTTVEKLIRHKATRKGVLVPLLEDLFQRPVDIESEEDVDWIADLLRRMVSRSNNRNSAPVFSPSQLASCLRYVYLLKEHKELGIKKAGDIRIEPNFYFFTGNFIHIKWQFALYKLDQKLPDEVFKLVGVEVPIFSKRKDHGGTVDALVLIYGELYVVDFKGLNVRTFGEITRGTIPVHYVIQIADYGMLYNSAIKNGKAQISKGLLVSESKGGPTPKHLIALHESEIEIKTHLPEVRSRLRELRKNGEENSIPPPECESTQTIKFLGCPFRNYCREEVREIAKRKRKLDNKNASKLRVATPERNGPNRSGRNSKRR